MTQIENKQIEHLSQQIELQNIRLEALNTRSEKNNVHYDEMKASLSIIESALLGNTISKDGGLVKRIETVENSVDILTKLLAGYKSKWLGVVWIASVVLGSIGFLYYISSIWKNIFK